jgi:steroid delta-isomerase-like uncharacterized protein
MPYSQVLLPSRRSALQIGGAGIVAAMVSSVAHAETSPQILDAWAAGWSAVTDPEKLVAISADDIVYEDVAIGSVSHGIAAFRALLAEAAGAIPDFKVQLFDGFATGDWAAAEYEISGTQTGDLPYLPASGKSFRIRAASVFVLAGGKIARESRYYDAARFLTALGGLEKALPLLGEPAATPGG